jgi:UDP-N-acetylmuramate--alanine ligase
MNFGHVRRVHFMGIGGAGVSGLAELLKAEGLDVSGCDSAPSETTDRLRSLGIEVLIGHSPDHIEGADVVGYSAAVPRSHPEILEAKKRSIRPLSRAELLGDVSRFKWGIAIAGTHGKTSTTSLTGFILTLAGLDPTVIVGGRVNFLGAHARLGHSEYLVCEADEFDRSFLHLWPVLSVITNIEAEHLDTYGDMREIESAFQQFADRVPFFGATIACLDEPGVRDLLPRLTCRKVTYGLSAGADVRGVRPELRPSGSGCTVVWQGREIGELTVPLVGRHMLKNALAATAVALYLGIPFPRIAEAVAAFSGVARRFERKGERGGVVLVDDYAHHPSEVAATLQAARQAFPHARLVVAFQPHLFSRTQAFAREFGEALLAADAAVVLPIYPARERPIPGVTHALVVEAALALGHRHAVPAASFDDALRLLGEDLRAGDVLLTLGAGNVVQLGERWLAGGAA